jgi:hypothetical protein
MRVALATLALLVAFLPGCAREPTADPTGPPTPDPDTPGPAPAPKVVLREDAESPGEWRARTWLDPGVDNRPGAGGWHPSGKEAHGGSRSWTFQDEAAGRYHDQAIYDLHAPTVDLAGLQKPEWRFFYKGDSEADSGDEFSWGLLVDGQLEALGSTDAPSPGWMEVRVDLASHAGRTVDLLFRFEADWCGGDTPLAPACGEGSFAGYFVDDIEVRESSPP